MKNFIRITLFLILINISILQSICNPIPEKDAESQRQVFFTEGNKKYYLTGAENKFGIYDENNNIILPCIFDNIIKNKYDDFIWVNKDNKQGLYYKTTEIIAPVYEKITIKDSMNYSKLYLCTKENGKIDIKYFEYNKNQMHNLSNDCEKVGFKEQHWIFKNKIFYIPVKKNNYFGLISFDTQNFEINEILPFEYEDMKYFYYLPKKKKSAFEYLCVQKNEKYSVLNFKDFKPIGKFLYDDIESLRGTKFLKVKNNGKYALYDTTKNINGEFLYDNIIAKTEHEKTVVYVIQNGKQKNINKGKVVLSRIKETGKNILLIPALIPCIIIPPLGFACFMYMEDTQMFKPGYTYVEY